MNDNDIPKLKVGQRLHHELFGAGTFEGFGKGFGGDGSKYASLIIAFDDHGRKEFLASFSASRLHKIPKKAKA